MNNNYYKLLNAIESKTAVLGVVGLGYVGLPLAVEMVKQGFRVVGIDLDAGKIDKIERGESYIHDIPSETLAAAMASGRFKPTTDYAVLSEIDAVSICVPTPLSENQDPDTSYIVTVVEQIKRYMKKGMLITLESTTYPGTTEELIQRELEKLGYAAGEDFFLCFSPERVDPSNSKFNTYNTPKVIGGTTKACLELGTALYSRYVQTVVPVSSPKVAEMSKLLENTFRSVNIAFVNEMAMMCDRMGIDIWEVIDAAKTSRSASCRFTGRHRRPLHSAGPDVPVLESERLPLLQPVYRTGPVDERQHALLRRQQNVENFKRIRQVGQTIENSRARHGLQAGYRRPARIAGACGVRAV
ncbi:hypothetical protein HMSSN036_10080 [Paenibacillus macerans]|nr:hypothetical protein HMSSN036_10080 [Paenibacillus macerans]